MPRKGGAAKAYRAMVKTYGPKKGRQVFYAKANTRRYGRKVAMHTRAQRFYKKGGHQ